MARGKMEAGEVAQEKARGLDELGPKAIEQVSETNFNVDLEKFMHEYVVIRVHDDNQEGSLPVICPSVKGINQPIVRGRDTPVRRKYVEALARCRTTTYEQMVQNPAEPANIQMIPKTVLSYPFQVVEDKNPKGQAWLKAILEQPA